MDAFNLHSSPFKRRRFDDDDSEDDHQKSVQVDEHQQQKPVLGPNSQLISFEADEAKNKKGWWDNLNRPDVTDEEFRAAFRMSRATFDMICDELDATVTKKNTTLREAVPVRQRVAVCIWRLATGEPLRLVSKRFELGISTCHKLVLEVCWAIKDVLMPKFLRWPEKPQLGLIKRRFESLSGIPNVAGSMYTTHVPIIAPKTWVAEYFNKRHTERKQRTTYSITFQGVVDDCGAFMDVCIGWPGSLPDDKVLEKSALYQRASRGLLCDGWVVGNSGHPLMDWVLVPYTQKNPTQAQHGFNERVGEIQRVAREAFTRLKGRWAFLRRRMEVKLQDLPVVLGACCILHNICEAREEAVAEAELFELFDYEMVVEKPVRSATARQARDRIADNLLRHGWARPLVRGFSTHSRWSSVVESLGQGQVLILFSRGSSDHGLVARLMDGRRVGSDSEGPRDD